MQKSRRARFEIGQRYARRDTQQPVETTAGHGMMGMSRVTPRRRHRLGGGLPVRQGDRKRNRMAEISVPAWPIPTQKTNVVMYTLQKTGGLYPACPKPSWRRTRNVQMPIRNSDTAPNNRRT